jgi:hypothetical protein
MFLLRQHIHARAQVLQAVVTGVLLVSESHLRADLQKMDRILYIQAHALHDPEEATRSSFLAAVFQGPIPLGDSSSVRDPLCEFSRAMAADVTVRVPDHHAEDVRIHLEDMRVLGTIRWNMTEVLGDIVATGIRWSFEHGR